MRRRGNCYDAVIGKLLLDRQELADRLGSAAEAKMEVCDYLEVSYNQRRRHSTLGQISPAPRDRIRLTDAGTDVPRFITIWPR